MSASSHRLGAWILVSLALGLAAGALVAWLGETNAQLLTQARKLAVAWLDPLGRVFLHLLFMVVIPLVFSTLALGVLQLGRLGGMGALTLRVGGLFALNMAIGVGLGLLAMNLFAPGHVLEADVRQKLLADFGGQAQSAVETTGRQDLASFSALVDMLLPRNFLKSLVDFQLLPLMLFALLVGAAGTRLSNDQQLRLRGALEVIADLMLRLVGWAMCLAPIAVPAMVFSVVVKAGLGVLWALGGFILICLGVMVLHTFGTMSLWVKFLARRSPWQFFKAIRLVLVTAFSTSSSSATLPTSLAVCRDELGVSPPVAGFVLPLGATLNMSGTALYEGCVVLFVAQVYGVPLTMEMQAVLLLMAVLSAVAVAGIPGGSLPLIAGLLLTFGIPPEGLAIILGADRLLDMARTTVNVTADLVTATVVDRHWRNRAKA